MLNLLPLLFGTICISSSAILVTLSAVEPTVSAFYRNFLAAIIWLLLFCLAGLRRSPFRPLPTIPRGAALATVFSLGLLFAIDLWSWHRCILCLGAGPATLMGNLQVLIVSILSRVVFGEQLRRWFWPGSLLALTGIALLTLTRGIGSEVVQGVLYGMLTAVTYSLFLLLLRVCERYELTTGTLLFWVSLFSALLLFVVVLGEDGDIVPRPRALAWLLLHAVLSSVVGWWFIISSLPRVPLAVASTLLLLQPVLTTIWGDLVLGQRLTIVQWAGVLLALAGIRLASVRQSGDTALPGRDS